MPTEVVADVSVAAKWHLTDEAHSDRAEQLRRDIKSRRVQLIVPRFWGYEVASVLSKAAAAGRIPEEDARLALQVVLDIPRLESPEPSPIEAFDAARRFNRSLIDCFYLRLAETQACDFWTDDRKLHRTLSQRYPFVRWIGDYPIGASSQG